MSNENKTIIYLDQNFISDIAKLSLKDKKDKVKPLLRELFEVVKQGVDKEQFLVPDSWIQAIETAAKNDTNLQEAIYNYQGYLGQVSLNQPWEIKNKQFIDALLSFYSKQSDKKEIWRTAFRENPNKRMESFKINIRLPKSDLNSIDFQSIDSLQAIREKGVKENGQYQAEILETKQYYKSLIKSDFFYFLKEQNISIEQTEQFIDSDQFKEIPNINIFCRLWSKNLANKNRKREQLSHDFNDIEFLSVYMPYCEVVATDKYMKELVQSLKLDIKYNCRLYTMKESELIQFISFLKQEQNIKKPANKSLFSIVCTMTEEKITYTNKFLKKLDLARNKFHNTGKYWNKEIYTSIFLIFKTKNNVKIPKSYEIQKKEFSSEQWSEMLIFLSDFKKIYNSEGKNIEDLVKGIPDYLKGAAVAILNDDSNFDEDMREHDSYLFYDIENAIKKHLTSTERYNIKIIYP